MRAVMALSSLAVAVVVALALGLELCHRERQLPIFAVAGRDPGRAARLMAERLPFTSLRCTGEVTGRDGAAILTALTIVEAFATSPIERWVEHVVLNLAGRLGISPPDLSYGPLQIRVSTMRKAVSLGDGLGSPRGLEDVCSARNVARIMIEQELRIPLGEGNELTRAQVLMVAAAFNGQSTPTTLVPRNLIANGVYREIVYHLFQEARFGQ